LLSLEAMVDSAFLWALALERLRAGSSMAVALTDTIGAVEAAGATGRFNFLLTDGQSIAATACGDTLWYRRSRGSVVVASEPGDDDPGWTEVPDRQVLTATPSLVSVRPLVAGTGAARADGPVTQTASPLIERTIVEQAAIEHIFSNAPSPNAPTTTSATKGSVTR
jgi:glutamine amidotransferase